MITIESYFCNSYGDDFVEVTPHVEYTFPDPRHVDGAIELTINGVAIFDKTMWDLVDQLWMYIVNMLEDMKQDDRADRMFPDQSLRFSFERVGDGLLKVTSFSSDVPRTAVVEESRFIDALKKAGIPFFETMVRLNPVVRNVEQRYADTLRNL
jgi:hypothetical protein